MSTAFANPIPAPAWMEPDGSWNRENYVARCRAYEAETENYIRDVMGGQHKHTGKILCSAGTPALAITPRRREQ